MMDRSMTMPRGLVSEKIQSRHRDRRAIVYIRQSTPQQVERHPESARLQYALADRAFQFGWPRESIVVIDDDQGHTAKTVEGRSGFQWLVAEVGRGQVGLVLGIEISRLARSCLDWYQLLEICALFDTLIADADAVYDPSNYNDRLLLGLKATMSEAELYTLKARMLEARRAKARRGELGKAVPMGYVHQPSGAIALDPDEQAQSTIRLVFELFERFRTINKVLGYLADHKIQMPVRIRGGERKGELAWHRPNRATLYNLFMNPIYAGAYVYGGRQTDRRRQKPGQPRSGRRPFCWEDADVFLPDRLPAYISWQQYQRNRAQIRANRPDHTGTARGGTALLSGLVICGRCGLRMTAQYNNNGDTLRYVCLGMSSQYREPVCQSLTGAPLDALVARLVLQALEPAALEVSLAVAKDLQAERRALDGQWQQRRERARYQVERARRQYDACEPENRLVARTLERSWEEALAEQARLEADYEQFHREQPQALSPAELAAIHQLAQDVPALWHADTTTQEERQTLIRLLLERVMVAVVNGSEQVQVQCHWHGGHQTAHQLVRPVRWLTSLSTYPDLVARASELHEAGHGFEAIAAILNQEGWRPAKRRDTFNGDMVRHLLLKVGVIEVKYRRPREIPRGPDEWTIRELAELIGMPQPTLYSWVQRGRLSSRSVSSSRVKLVHADATVIAALKAMRATPLPWRRLPRHFATTTSS